MHRTLVALIAFAAGVAAAQGPVTSVPPARFPGGGASQKAAAEPALVAPGLGPARVIELGAPSPVELAPIGSERKLAGAGAAKEPAQRRPGGPLQIGIAREVPAADARIDGAGLDWLALPDGRRVARIELGSAGASAVRIRVVAGNVPEGTSLRFSGSATGRVFGPYGPADLLEPDGLWSPVLEGERVVIEIVVPGEAEARSLALRIPQVSHLAVAGPALRDFTLKRETDIGRSDGCEIDVKCVTNPSQALLDAASAVAKIVLTDNGVTYVCTGTVLNDSIQSFRPYFTTGRHCIMNQRAASTINTYWFFDARSCGSLAVPPYVLQAGGASLLAASSDYDWILLELRQQPPAGVVYSAWRAEPIPFGAALSTLHHPRGDLKKFSQGNARDYSVQRDVNRDGSSSGGGTFLGAQWSQGSTEVGSSGAGLFTFLSGGGYYELRGTLYGGNAFCSNPAGVDYFTRFDVALPLVREYLTPDAAYRAGVTPVVEFYNRGLDHYFVTASPIEIALLDAGTQFPGWERTGFRFLAYTSPNVSATASPVCRFYLKPEFGDSHFYSASPAECADVMRLYGDSWTFESPSVFWIELPDRAGNCPAGTTPIYRFYRSTRINHRFTPETSIRDDLIRAGAIQEGYGNPPNQVAMCAPSG